MEMQICICYDENINPEMSHGGIGGYDEVMKLKGKVRR